jgi:8-oxo-dGTP diphosphatase
VKYDVATPYTACFAILRRGNEVAFVLRQNTGWMDGYYGLPAGKVEKNETFTAGVVREAKEEAGVTIDPADIKHAITVHRKASDSLWVDVYFEVSRWQGEPYNAEPHVHGALDWLDMNDLPENIVPAFRYALEQVAAGETYGEFGWENVEKVA